MPGHQSAARCTLRALAARVLVALAALGVVSAAHAQEATWPARPVRLVVTSGAGGASDLNARVIAPKLSALWNQPVIVENRPGGSFIVGTEHVARSAPDGYTLLVTITNLAQHPATRKNLPYDTLRDIAPITRLHLQRLFFVIDSKLPANTLQEFIALARAHPGKYNFASYGNVSTAHLLLAKLTHDAKIDLVHVAYPGMVGAVRAVLAGDAAVAAFDLPNVQANMAAGRVRPIASTGSGRSPHMPDIPTFEESGVPGFAVGIWAGLFAPGATPVPVLDRIAADYAKALATPEVQEWYRKAGVETVADTPAGFREIVTRDIAYWTNLVQTTQIKLD